MSDTSTWTLTHITFDTDRAMWRLKVERIRPPIDDNERFYALGPTFMEAMIDVEASIRLRSANKVLSCEEITEWIRNLISNLAQPNRIELFGIGGCLCAIQPGHYERHFGEGLESWGGWGDVDKMATVLMARTGQAAFVLVARGAPGHQIPMLASAGGL